MARRKNGFLSDGSDDSDASMSGGSEDDGFNSQEDGDSRAERALFEHNGRKRRRTGARGGKDQAWEGIFGEDEDVGRAGGRGLGSKRGGRGGKSGGGRTDWTKAPTFVSKSAKQDGEEETNPDDEDEEDSEDEDEDEDEDKPPSPRVREDDYDEEKPPLVRSMRAAEAEEGENKPKKGGRGGIGSASRGRGGIGSTGRTGMPSFAAASSAPTTESGDSTPSAASPHPGIGMSSAPSGEMGESTPQLIAPKSSFGRPPASLTENSATSSRPRQKFMPAQAAPTAAPTVPLTAQEKAHFSSISNSFGARLLAKQGWQAGKGLGIAEDGRAVPIAAGVHLRGAGISKGVRTEDSKREARRKGEKFSDDEEEEERARRRGKGKKGGQGQGQGGQGQGRQEPKEDSWKKQKKVKVRVEHKTYEQLVAEAADSAASGVGLVLDARGGELREVQSLSNLSLSSWTPTSDATQLPELRHNLRLIVDIAKGDVEALAREGKSVNERRKWAVREEQLARQRIDETEKRITRLTRVQELVQTISTLASEQAAHSHPTLTTLSDSFNTLLDDYKAEYASEQLDEVVVGAIAQVMRRPFADWEPFDPSSDILLSSLKSWKRAYNLSTSETSTDASANRQMTAWESVLWNLWLPKVRSTINNDWDPLHPRAAIHLIESWEPILPPFIRDNILDQLILPKVRKAVEEWDARKQSASLYKIVWPWFSVLGERMDEILEGAKRRIRSVLRHWVVKDGPPKELSRWKKDIYSSSEWDKLVLQYVVPKLGVCLREDFQINPANQNMIPFTEWVMPWHDLIRGSMMAHLLDVEFFPKWLDTLYLWLVHPGYKPDEVANWFLWWKEQFPPAVRDHDSTQHAFKQALDLMNQAVELGDHAPQRLRKPVFQPLPPRKSSSSSKSKSKSKGSTPIPRQPAPEQVDITFRNLAEEYAAQNDLIFLPLGKSDSKTGKPLFRVSKGVDGRKGVTVYVGESAVFAQAEDGEFRAISLDDMVKRAVS